MGSADNARAEIEHFALESQHGAISRKQALDAGMTAAQIDRRLRRQQWLPSGSRGWYVLAEQAADPLAALSAATRAMAGPAWVASALALFELRPHPTVPMVASDRDHAGPNVQRVHVTRLAQLPRTVVDAIDTVTAAVAVVAAGRWLRTDVELHLLIDSAIRNGATSWAEVERVLQYFPRRGRAGSTRMRLVLADHGVDPALPLSDWGRQFVAGIIDAALPRPLMEYRVLDRSGRLVAQVDAGYPDHRYAIELDSRAHHLTVEAFERDRQRDGDLAQIGWMVRRFTWRQWHERRPWVVATIKADLEHRATAPGAARPTHRQSTPG